MSQSIFYSVKLMFHLTYRISVNSNNVQSLLDAANQYQIEPVKKMCVDFLKEQVDASNCLGKKYQIPGFFFFSKKKSSLCI